MPRSSLMTPKLQAAYKLPSSKAALSVGLQTRQPSTGHAAMDLKLYLCCRVISSKAVQEAVSLYASWMPFCLACDHSSISRRDNKILMNGWTWQLLRSKGSFGQLRYEAKICCHAWKLRHFWLLYMPNLKKQIICGNLGQFWCARLWNSDSSGCFTCDALKTSQFC